MSQRRRRRRKSPRWSRIALLLIFLAAAIYASLHCVFRAPEQADPNQETDVSQQTQEAHPLHSHQERKKNFYTILVSGTDDNNGGSDTNILVAVDTENKYIYGVSIPRDTKATVKGESRKINFAFNSGGMALLSEVVSDQLGIPIDYTVQVDLQGFVALVDAIGGVTFDVPINMNYEDPYQNLYIHISKGTHTLNGKDALKVVRFRKGYASQDIGRMETQQAFLKAVAQQTLTLSNLGKIDDFVKIFRTHVETNLTLGNLAWLGNEAISMGAEAINFSTLPGEWHDPYIYLDPEATLTLVNTYLNPYVEDRLPEDLNLHTR